MHRDERLVRHVVYLLVVIDVDLEVPQANAQFDAVIQPGLHVVFDGVEQRRVGQRAGQRARRRALSAVLEQVERREAFIQ
eukprot:2460963-Prymnesium_polylepis.1